jgi:ribosome maturation factor RimP
MRIACWNGTEGVEPVASQRRGGGAQAARVAEIIAPVTREAGFDLEDVTVSRVGRRHLVRVVVDSDSGVDLDAIAEVSRSVSSALDDAEQAGPQVVAGEYVLEVTSPGVDRPLTEPRHWRRNIGRLVTVPAQRGDGVTRHVTGRITAADERRVMLEVDGGTCELSYDDLGAGRVQVELQRGLEDGGADDPDVGEGESR